MKKTSTILSRFVYVLNIVAAILLFITCIISYLKVDTIHLFSVLSLFVPFLFILNVIFCVFWILKKKRRFLLSLSVLLIGYFVFGAFYGIGNKLAENKALDLKIMTFNAWSFNKNEWMEDLNVGDRIIQFIKDESPDILCIQEHDRQRSEELAQYPYSSITPNSSRKTTQAIFSMYPIVEKGSLNLPSTGNNIIYADILYGNDTLRVYNLHLQSFKIVPSSESFSEKETGKNYKRLVDTFSKQLEQAMLFDSHIKDSPYRNIVCGDFNNTQFSNVYRIIKDDLQDSFLEKGSGFGRTYSLFGFPLRIDYILSDATFEIVSHTNFDEKLSDHYPVVATLRYKSD